MLNRAALGREGASLHMPIGDTRDPVFLRG